MLVLVQNLEAVPELHAITYYQFFTEIDVFDSSH